MTRYTAATGNEAEYEPGSRGRVLRNLLGIKRKREMNTAEYEALAQAQERYVTEIDSETLFTEELIRRMHRDWLGEIYEWAGRYRTVELSKEDFVWPPAYLIPTHMMRFERDVLAKHTPCHHQALAEVCRSIAIVHAEFLLIHPFREGNGRLARWVADLMASQAGFPLPVYEFRGRGGHRERQRYLRAVVSGYGQNYEDLARFFEEAVFLRSAG